MARIKLTKGELKRQRDALYQYQRYLPILQLKKQQLQIEILQQHHILLERRLELSHKIKQAMQWAGLLADPGIDLRPWLTDYRIITQKKNVAGIDIPIFERVEFCEIQYDLYLMPLWVDTAIELLRRIISLEKEIKVLETGIDILRAELRIATQRVNLFEKIKIPQASEAIRMIKIYIGDQMANAVGRSKIAKRKIEKVLLEEIVV